jgi:unsaturated rhamnogalacturonyl hydrolase
MSTKKFKTIILGIVLLISMSVSCAKPYSVWMADSEIRRNPQSWMVDFSKKPKWSYCSGLELQSIYQVWKLTGNQKYYDYVKSYADTIINSEGRITGYKMEDYSLDNLNSGKFLYDLLLKTNDQKYKKAIDILRSQVKNQPRTSDGGFWHKKIYPNQMWLDGLYMASPFLAEYAFRFGDKELYDEATHQILTVAKHTYDPKTGLYYHGWDESHNQRWSNPKTGTSPNFWSRSIGWYMMAMVDVLDYLPVNHPKRPEIIKILLNLSQSLEKYRDTKTGMWFQITDKPGETGNYLESSGSAMFIYSWVKASQKGYLPKSFGEKGKKAYIQFVNQFIRKNTDGTITLTDACLVSGLGGQPRYRDGSFQYYINEPKRNNDAKAVSPFIMVSVLLNK